MKNFKKIRGQEGQGMTEYILIVALIAVFVIGAVKLFGKNTKKGFKDAADQVGTSVDQAVKQSNKSN
jgi:Flp pilus assembly pilin Flp